MFTYTNKMLFDVLLYCIPNSMNLVLLKIHIGITKHLSICNIYYEPINIWNMPKLNQIMSLVLNVTFLHAPPNALMFFLM